MNVVAINITGGGTQKNGVKCCFHKRVLLLLDDSLICGKTCKLVFCLTYYRFEKIFRQNERSQILTLLPRQRISSKTEKDKQINKHWNTHSQQQGSGWFLIKTVEKFLFKREKDVDSRLVSLALEITLTQVHTVVHRTELDRATRAGVRGQQRRHAGLKSKTENRK